MASTVPLAELGRFVKVEQDPIIYHKDLRPMEYVVGDTVGRLGAPIYAMLEIEDQLADYTTPDGQDHLRHLLHRAAAGQRHSPASSGAASGPSPTRPSATWGWPSAWPWC